MTEPKRCPECGSTKRGRREFCGVARKYFLINSAHSESVVWCQGCGCEIHRRTSDWNAALEQKPKN